jgi:hypothetical protein
MVKLIIFSVLVNGEEPRAIQGALFNEYDYEYAIEARRRGGKGNKKRRRGGNGLR